MLRRSCRLSIRLMAAVFDLDIPAREKLVLLAMADHARDDGSGCYPSVERLTRKTSTSRRGVQGFLRRLEDAGFVVPTARVRGGRNLTTEYTIILEKGAQGALFSGPGGRTATQERAHADAQKGARRAPEPSGTTIEPRSPESRRQQSAILSDDDRLSNFLFEKFKTDVRFSALDVSHIEFAMQQVRERASSPPGSLRYWIVAIEKFLVNFSGEVATADRKEAWLANVHVGAGPSTSAYPEKRKAASK